MRVIGRECLNFAMKTNPKCSQSA